MNKAYAKKRRLSEITMTRMNTQSFDKYHVTRKRPKFAHIDPVG